MQQDLSQASGQKIISTSALAFDQDEELIWTGSENVCQDLLHGDFRINDLGMALFILWHPTSEVHLLQGSQRYDTANHIHEKSGNKP